MTFAQAFFDEILKLAEDVSHSTGAASVLVTKDTSQLPPNEPPPQKRRHLKFLKKGSSS
jgi:hypothetical protein